MAFFANILGNLSPPILAKYKKNVSFFSYKRVIKIPLLYEIQPFDNTEKVYESNSGHSVENWSSENFAHKFIILKLATI